MKFKNIILTGVAVMALASCNDYLEVEAPSSYTEEFVFSQKSEIQRVLNGVYAQILVDNLYGNLYQSTFILNSDVDIAISSNNAHAHNTYSRFDCDDQGGEINKFWTAAYSAIETANRFINGVEKSSLYDTSDSELMQWLGEAKCMRAMIYHDLVVMFGDVPFTFQPTAVRGTDPIPVGDRLDIQKALIEDLEKIAPFMSSTSSVTVEHCSKEFAQALAARIALTAAGYSLRPNKSDSRSYGTMQCPDEATRTALYQKVLDNAGAVIKAGTHDLRNSYQQVFVNECNYQVVNDDDPIFEIPFAKMSTGNTGYLQGPEYKSNEGETVGPWGECKGSARLNAFYRYLFRVIGTAPNIQRDKRCEFVNGMWYYTYQTKDGALVDSAVVRNDYYVHNNKWSKLWTSESSALGKISTGATGINYPYMRYADVLLMYAEAANELNGGPTAEAVEYLQKVHNRAFPAGDPEFMATAQGGKEAFQKAVLDERKWEFAGENSRWRDLVRTNTYGKELVYSFLRYYHVAMDNAGQPTEFEDAIKEHDGSDYISNLPSKVFFHDYNLSDVAIAGLAGSKNQPDKSGFMYSYTFTTATVPTIDETYPNQSLKSLRIFNPYTSALEPMSTLIKQFMPSVYTNQTWRNVDFYQWGNSNTGLPQDQVKYSFYGYIRCNDGGNLLLCRDGAMTQFTASDLTSDNLPVVRYILPYPNEVVQRSSGVYKNYYGY